VDEPNARERSRADTRQRLLRAGMELLAERGLNGVTAAALARRAGVAVGTLYLHFGGKPGLARQILGQAADELGARLAAAAAGGGDPAERARARAEALVGFAEERAAFARVLFAGDAGAAPLAAEALDGLAAVEEKRLRRDLASGACRADVDPTVAAQALVGMEARVLGRWLAARERASRRAVVDTLATLRAVGLHGEAQAGAPPRAVRTGRPRPGRGPGKKGRARQGEGGSG